MSKKTEKNNIITRPPVVVVLGHVDHGKSSLLEAIKDFEITSKESGGITQHVGAYEIEENGKKITFLDTPGHEAFSAIRSRGAKAADIAILVVAADEGVKEQTEEAISHIKKAKIPIIVAINKMDKPGADSKKVQRELADEEILLESIGGKVPSIAVSAKTKKGILELLEMILLVAEMENLTADISKPAEGVIVESYVDANRGPVATLIPQNGVLNEGDIIGTSSVVGKIKTLENFQGNPVEKALPSMPVIALGFEDCPKIGDKFRIFKNIDEAKKEFKEPQKITESAITDQNKKTLNIILKADVFGSLEAIIEILKALPKDKVDLRILKAEVGEINEADIKTSETANALILGFRVKVSARAKNLAIREKIRIMNFDIIYELSQRVKEISEKMIEPEVVINNLGKGKVIAIFLNEKNRQIVGVKVTEGVIKKGALLNIFRDDEKVGEGRIINLKREDRDIDEGLKGSECGVLYEGNIKIEEKDILEVYIKERRKIGAL